MDHRQSAWVLGFHTLACRFGVRASAANRRGPDRSLKRVVPKALSFLPRLKSLNLSRMVSSLCSLQSVFQKPAFVSALR